MNREPWPESEKEAVSAMIAAGKTAREVAAVTGRSRSAIIKAVRAYGLGTWNAPPGPRAEIPEGFAEAYQSLTYAELSQRYHRSTSRISCWVNRLGLTKQRGPKPKPVTTRPGPKPVRKPATPREFVAAGPKLAIVRPTRDTSAAGEAADYLRRFGPVIRCNSRGAYDPAGDHWLRGSTVLTADDVIARARRNGWNPDAWHQAA